MKSWNQYLSHQKDDLIHKYVAVSMICTFTFIVSLTNTFSMALNSCSYDGVECEPDDVIPQMTDMSQCYTFNIRNNRCLLNTIVFMTKLFNQKKFKKKH